MESFVNFLAVLRVIGFFLRALVLLQAHGIVGVLQKYKLSRIPDNTVNKVSCVYCCLVILNEKNIRVL